ncbi:Hsp70 family protein [uncultured Pseudonocardia sp.]|uniref:Hsp70 family protein n=1 Tax=uncultured Pseudonocardia sp. TaxID=211455 RepID=UPI00262590CD|nr:hypothetical protein [uncultured Pseudonocardia sp.]
MSTDSPIIGFDLGHGETALALAYADATDAPKVLDLPGASRRQHVSAVAQGADGRIVIGEEAIRADDVMRLWLTFKSRNLADPDTRKPMQLLVQRIVADITDNGTIPDADAVRWVFGAPSGWTGQHYADYEKLLAEAGLTGAQVVAESRAALLYARDSGEVNVRGKRIKQGVLIVDIGSSTTDYTYVTELAQRPVDHGNVDLGAALIDKEIMRRAVARHPEGAELAAKLTRDPHSARKLELAARESKEKYFRTRREELAASGKRVGVYYPLELTSGEEYQVDLRLSVADMDAVLDTPQPALGDRSWFRAFAEDVESAVQRAAGKVDLLLLTGGPSRMPFVLDVCRKLLGNDRVALGNEPEVAIARGLALAGRMSIRAAGFRRDVTAVKPKIAPLVKERIPELAQAMAEAVASGMTDRHVIPAFVAWREMGIDTLAQMVDRVVRGVKSDVEARNNSRISAVTATWQNKLRAELDNITRPICNRWHIEPEALRLPPISVKAGGKVAVDVDTKALTQDLDTAANAVNAVVAGVVAVTLFGAGTAIIAATGPFAVIFAAVIGFAALTAGKEELMERLNSAKIPKMLRQLKSEASMTQKLREKAASSEAELATTLAAEFEKEFGRTLVAQVAGQIGTQLDAVADEAELLIK